jgi:Holliday junction resolvase RusA-like endonuclease
MRNLEFTIPGEVISKKNGQKIIRCGKFPRIMAGDAYVKWEKQAIQELQFKRTPAWTGYLPCELHCFFYRKTKRAFDYSNMIESIQDMLVKAAILPEDDFLRVIPVIEGMDIDKVHPRVFVTITPPSKIYNHGV